MIIIVKHFHIFLFFSNRLPPDDLVLGMITVEDFLPDDWNRIYFSAIFPILIQSLQFPLH